MICKMIFCSEFPDIPDIRLAEKREEREEEEHRQLQSVMRFTQTQQELNNEKNFYCKW